MSWSTAGSASLLGSAENRAFSYTVAAKQITRFDGLCISVSILIAQQLSSMDLLSLPNRQHG